MDTNKKKQINLCLLKIKEERRREPVEELYELISATVRHIALKYLHNKELADELIQDFWGDIYKIADKFVFYYDGMAYLCKVVKNRAINKYRSVRRERERIIYVDYSSYTALYGEHIDRAELLMIVGDAMSKLSNTEKIIIQSTYFEEKTVRQIAAELKISKSQVHRHKQNALKVLRKYFSEDERLGEYENEKYR